MPAYQPEHHGWLVTEREHYPEIWLQFLDAALKAQLEPFDWVSVSRTTSPAQELISPSGL
jgi:hypothetical protein